MCHCATRRGKKKSDEPSNHKVPEVRGYFISHRHADNKVGKRNNPHLKCIYCNVIGHVKEMCWILHLKLKPKFNKDPRMTTFKPSSMNSHKAHYTANHASSVLNHGAVDFTANPTSLINEFAVSLQGKIHEEDALNPRVEDEKHTALLRQFVGFLTDHDHDPSDKTPGIFQAFSIALKTSLSMIVG